MAAITIRITDNSSLTLSEMRAAVQRGLTACGLHLEGEAAEELENPPRRVDTGRLKGSISSAVDGDTLYVGTNVEYAGYVHNGTRRMAPNSFLKNAFVHNVDQIKDYLESELKGR